MTSSSRERQPVDLASMLGGSAMAARVRAFDWASTPLGPIEAWPMSLLISVGICLNSRFPMFVWWGPELINLYNDGYVPVLGARHPAALGRPARDSWSEIWADVGPQADLVMQQGKATWNERVHLRMERHGFPEDTWFTWSYSPIRDESGKVGGLFCACTEDTGRVLAERERDALALRFRALVTASSDVVYRMSPDWSEMRALQGRDFIEEMSDPSQTWLDRYILPDDHARVIEAIERAIRDRSIFQLEHRVRRVDGSVGWTLSRAVPILDPSGEVSEWFGAASDVTARRNAEETLRASEAALKETDRRKDEFLAMLAHELRNPLAPISNALQMLRLSSSAETTRLAQDVMDRQVKQMVRLVDDLLDVSRITRGKVELKKSVVSLSEVIDAALETVRPLLRSRMHRVRNDVPQGIWVDADTARLAQVFANILHNAAKFTPRSGLIELCAEQAPGGVRVSVRDEGIGIPREQLVSIFDMFAQGDQSLERSESGLGIGLTIVKTLVEMHGGTVEALSDGLGHGATFSICLPTREAPGAFADTRSAASPTAPLRLLVVDDNRDSAGTLGTMLELLGHDVRLEYDGPSALRCVRQFRPDAAFLDIGLPGMNGYEVCECLKADPASRDIVVIAQTGWGDAAQRSRSREAGFDHHLVKPVDIALLADVLAAIKQTRPQRD